MQRVFFYGLCLSLCLCLSGCGAASWLIKSDTLAFDDVIEDTTNKFLVLNTLRARDKAPLHFADIPLLRESIEQTASLSYLNLLGPRVSSQPRDSLTLGAGIRMSPSFEVNHLQSKDFNTGIASPIDPKFVKYWLDRGLDRRIVLLMFFSAVELIETRSEKGPKNAIRIMNSPRDAIDVITARKQPFGGPDELKCDTQSDFERYLKLLNNLSTFFAHNYKERRLIASGLKFDVAWDSKILQDFATMDPNKAQLVYDTGRSAYNLYAISPEPKVAFCFFESDRSAAPLSQAEFISAVPAALSDRRKCSQPVVEVAPEDSTRPQVSERPVFFPGAALVRQPSLYCDIYNRFIGTEAMKKTGDYPKLELRLHMRSVGEIFQFLGDLLHYQDEIQRFLDRNRELNLKINTPVTFGYCADQPAPGCNNIFFRLDEEPCNARFMLRYRDRKYFVANFDPPAEALQSNKCSPGYVPRRDHTLEVLAVLHQLVGLNKSAADIRATPTVQVLP